MSKSARRNRVILHVEGTRYPSNSDELKKPDTRLLLGERIIRGRGTGKPQHYVNRNFRQQKGK